MCEQLIAKWDRELLECRERMAAHKEADRRFLDDQAPTSLHQTLVSVRGASPIGGLLGPLESHSSAFGVAIAIGETAIGLGLLTGLFTRIAAAGGMLLSLGLFLTVSWNADPWYTGADIVFLFALSPLLIFHAFTNWDLLAMALTSGALWAWSRRKPVLAGTLIGLGTAAKLYPVFLLVALLILAWRTRRWSGFGELVRKAPFVSGAVILLIGLYIGVNGWLALPR